MYWNLSLQEKRRHQYPAAPVRDISEDAESDEEEPLPPRVRTQENMLTGSAPPRRPSLTHRSKSKLRKGRARIDTGYELSLPTKMYQSHLFLLLSH